MNKAKEFWDKASKNYDKSEERFEYIHDKTRESTKNHLKINDIVLDYGCGTGTASCELSNLVKEVHALDISSEMIEIAKNKAAENNVENVDFEQSTIFDNRYKKESFDVILAFNMLHTVNSPQNVISRIHDLLKNDGVFITATPCLKDRKSLLVSMQMLLVSILSRVGIIPISIRRYRRSDVDKLLENGGFQKLKTEEVYEGASSYFVVAKKILQAQ